MSYLVLARKHRPGIFDDVIGQEHITELLRKGLTSGRLAHAFLFCGPRGIGKTSCARILAKGLNCQEGPTDAPCGKCVSCQEIAKGTSFDVLEIDGASNRGIDEIRTLRENVKFTPTFGKFKVYIVDEVHMLTMEAFNALLKTLEEPPEHVKFIFATTDPNKVPATIISRCQRYDFRRIPVKTTVLALTEVAKKENFEADPEALYAIARVSQGSLRDALGILDQLSAISDRALKGEDVYKMLGMVEQDLLFELVDALGDKNCSSALQTLDAIIDKGKDPRQLGKDLIDHFRNLMVIKVGGKTLGKLVDYPVNVKEQYLAQTAKFSVGDILRAIDVLIETQDVARITEMFRIPLEIAFARLTCSLQTSVSAGLTPVSVVPQTAPAVKPVVNAPIAPAPVSAPIKTSPVAAPRPQGPAAMVLDTPAPASVVTVDPAATVKLEDVKAFWNEITFAVSREKMSIATYLQEGVPVAVNGPKLTIGFSKENEFHKETLEESVNRQLVEKVLLEKLRVKLILDYKIADVTPAARGSEQEDPLVKSALDAFQGKIVNRWHNE